MANWKILYESVIGSSHQSSNLPCQDCSMTAVIDCPTGNVAIAVCADGAGSASFSDEGASLTCEKMLHFITEHLHNTGTVSTIELATALEWAERIQCALHSRATVLGVTIRDLACTLLVAIVGCDAAVFIQVGDGVIIYKDGDEQYRHVFWPDRGEFANTTSFITQPCLSTSLAFQRLNVNILEFAVLTDGLQMLALEYNSKSAHQPFFADLFSQLHRCDEVQILIDPFRHFLESDAVNARTDDDKTLVLASRVANPQRPQ